jgi:hypothetical protein
VLREDAFAKIGDRIEKGRQLRNKEISSADEYAALKAERGKWSDYNHELLKRLFTTDEAAKEYSFFGFGTGTMNATWQTRLDELRTDIDLSVHRLESIQERLELIPVSDTSAGRGERCHSLIFPGPRSPLAASGDQLLPGEFWPPCERSSCELPVPCRLPSPLS